MIMEKKLSVSTINDLARKHGHCPELLSGQAAHYTFRIGELHEFAHALTEAAATAALDLETRVQRLIEDASIAGQVVTISTEARRPLAMGNYRLVYDIRPGRARATPKPHEAHCNLRWPATLNTAGDYCNCARTSRPGR